MLSDMVPPGWLASLDELIEDKSITIPDLNLDDFYPSLLNNCYWNGKNGHPLAKTDDAHLWVLPLGFMTNTLMYRADIFTRHNLKIPKNIDEMIEVGLEIQKLMDEGKEPNLSAPMQIRGIKGLQMLYGGVWQLIRCWGGTDIDKNLNPVFASEENIKGLTKVKEMIEKVGNYKNYPNITWEDVMTDLGQGKVAFTVDAVPIGAWLNIGQKNPEEAQVAFAPAPYGDDPDKLIASTWSWNLGINASSKNKKAAWLFVQYVTGKKMSSEGSIMIMPPRASVAESQEWLEKTKRNRELGLMNAWEKTLPYSTFIFTPNAGFSDYAYVLSGEIQNAIMGVKTPEQAMKDISRYYKENIL